ncbi:Spy/CpxP family protein refolding chaperone [Massilia sp.]|uniref:Spy/CpxP family protein refolding chaperone n=1 Tax=Massilia sp. TaxID=1882437 RepID=UPI0028A1F1B6|nr:Spy/CpxP family protein refolding chaperone [Massilia sp.]
MTLHPIRTAVAAAFAACLLAAPAIHAQPMPPGGALPADAGPGFGPGAPFLRGLDLSEAQQDRVFAILHEQAPKRRELDKAERKAHDALHALAGGTEFDAAAATPHAQAFGRAIAEQELLKLRTDAQLMAVLTPEQRAQLREDTDDRPARTGRKGERKDGNKDGQRRPSRADSGEARK